MWSLCGSPLLRQHWRGGGGRREGAAEECRRSSAAHLRRSRGFLGAVESIKGDWIRFCAPSFSSHSHPPPHLFFPSSSSFLWPWFKCSSQHGLLCAWGAGSAYSPVLSRRSAATVPIPGAHINHCGRGLDGGVQRGSLRTPCSSLEGKLGLERARIQWWSLARLNG